MKAGIKFDSIDTYHRQFPPAIRSKLNEIRKIILNAAPGAEEVISYNMPAFKAGKVLVYYAGQKAHLGFYPTSAPIIHFAKELEKYKTSKGAIQFPYEKPLPGALIKKIVKFRLAQVAAGSSISKRPVS